MKLRLYYPITPWIVTQSFGENLNSFYQSIGLKGHNGIDLRAADRQLIRAAHDGTVTFTGEDGSGGLGVVIRTDEQFDYNGSQSYFKTVYWHIAKGGFLVKAGQKVYAGDPIALADNTGYSTGTHLHFSLKPVYQGEKEWEWWNIEQDNGYKGSIDPEPYLVGISAEQKFNDNISGLRATQERLMRYIIELLQKKLNELRSKRSVSTPIS